MGHMIKFIANLLKYAGTSKLSIKSVGVLVYRHRNVASNRQIPQNLVKPVHDYIYS